MCCVFVLNVCLISIISDKYIIIEHKSIIIKFYFILNEIISKRCQKKHSIRSLVELVRYATTLQVVDIFLGMPKQSINAELRCRDGLINVLIQNTFHGNKGLASIYAAAA